MKEKVSIISLGCARNLVDTEVMAGLLQQGPYEVVSEPSEADIVLINTCSFIDAAKEESVDTILETARLKEEGRLKTLVVAGCLPQRYSEELSRELPEVDLFIGTGEVPRIVDILKGHREGKRRRAYVGIPRYLYDDATPRLLTTPSHTAFLKVSEGCDHKCAFCIIPQLRGPHRSRPIDSVVKEAGALAQAGVKEINLIAQDLTAYGRERRDGATLYGLLREMVEVPRIQWIRLLYSYPNFLDEPLLRLIHENEKICKYVDIPFQHISPGILRRMRRGKSGSAVSEAVDKLRRMIPGVTLRTSLIVGFPGETEEDFQQLLDFVEEAQFDRLGVFKYSVEEGTPAALMGNHIPEQEKEIRWQEVMDLQASISRKKNESLIGTLQLVMIDRYDAESARWLGRTQAHAPEVDGLVYLVAGRMDRRGGKFRPGDLARARITGALDYDLIGAILAD
ncbi:MAG: 30S ribosomal protein S12 methylthiotransferase RimO [Deltaproteobacteria bacterium]|nr:30S ribosomal protein S12 methylthiotransferase RimO [Deltaproteobacteria bacterium]